MGCARQVFPHIDEAHLVQLGEPRFHLALVGDGPFQPRELFCAQSHRHRLALDATGPLVARPALAGLGALQYAAQGDPADLAQLRLQTTKLHR